MNLLPKRLYPAEPSTDLYKILLEKTHGPVIDPFTGCGQILNVAATDDRQADGIDPFSIPKAWYRSLHILNKTSGHKLDSILNGAIKILKQKTAAPAAAVPFRQVPDIQQQFHTQTLNQLGNLRAYLNTHGEVGEAISIQTLNNIRYVLLPPETSTNQFEPHPQPELLLKHIPALVEQLHCQTPKNKKYQPTYFSSSALTFLPGLESASYGAAITCPPHFNTTDLISTFNVELAWLDHHRHSSKNIASALLSNQHGYHPKNEAVSFVYRKNPDMLKRICKHAKITCHNVNITNQGLQNYTFEMSLILNELNRLIKPGGHILFFLQNTKPTLKLAPCEQILASLGDQLGLVPLVIENLPTILAWNRPS